MALPWLVFGLIWPLVAAALTIAARGAMLTSVVLFLVVPALAWTWARPAAAWRAGLFAIVIATPTILWIDAMAHASGQWGG